MTEMPQATAAGAYRHAAQLVQEVANLARTRQQYVGGPVFVRVERLEHLAQGLQEKAEAAS